MDQPLPRHTIPDGVSAETVDALGKLSEALEYIEAARGHLYSWHRLLGGGDLTLGEAVEALRDAGHDELADRVETELVGRNVLEGRWSFQTVEDFDENYWSTFRALEREARESLVEGRTHLFEARMKEDRRTHGRRHHEAAPSELRD